MAPLGSSGFLASYLGTPFVFGTSIMTYRVGKDRPYAILAFVISAGVIVAVLKNFVFVI